MFSLQNVFSNIGPFEGGGSLELGLRAHELRLQLHACNLLLRRLSRSYEEEDTCMSYEEEDTCMSYEEEDTCMSYEEEDTCVQPAPPLAGGG